jgi:hypothetical protein
MFALGVGNTLYHVSKVEGGIEDVRGLTLGSGWPRGIFGDFEPAAENLDRIPADIYPRAAPPLHIVDLRRIHKLEQRGLEAAFGRADTASKTRVVRTFEELFDNDGSDSYRDCADADIGQPTVKQGRRHVEHDCDKRKAAHDQREPTNG